MTSTCAHGARRPYCPPLFLPPRASAPPALCTEPWARGRERKLCPVLGFRSAVAGSDFGEQGGYGGFTVCLRESAWPLTAACLGMRGVDRGSV